MANFAIFGGTFNPFHIAHYEMLAALCKLDFIDEVLVTPDNIPPHKKCDFLASNEQRIKMCSLACEDFSKARLNLIEFERDGKSYTYDTVLALKNHFPNDEFFVVCGGDMIMTLDSWYNFSKLKHEVQFIAFNREGYAGFDEKLEALKNLGVKILLLQDKITDVSSTALRNHLDKSLIPSKIYEYIVSEGIYDGKQL